MQGENDSHFTTHSCHMHANKLHTPFFPKIWAREKCVETFKVKMKRSTCTSKTIGRSRSTYNCQEIDLENWEDRLGVFEKCRDYYD